VEDYYKVLGLDPGSSEDSIKVAYRRMAREAHPDRNMHKNAEQQADAATRMAGLNRAYAVLSDAKKRRAYDQELKTIQLVDKINTNNGKNGKNGAKEQKDPPPSERTAGPGRMRPGAEVSGSVASEFTSHLKQQLESNKKIVHMKPTELEGFHWALEAGSWSAHYCVAMRNFATVNVEAIKKFANYAGLAVDHSSSNVRGNYFLFLLTFQRLQDPEQVSNECRQVVASLSKKAMFGLHPYVALLDVEHGRSLVWGKPSKNKDFAAILNTLRLREG
jgi:DnaJ domain